MVTADQLFAHLVGDYCLQSDWQALKKTEQNLTGWTAVLVHAFTYSLPFLFLRPSLKAWAFIVITHVVIDHWRLARYVCWLKNFWAPKWITFDFLETESAKKSLQEISVYLKEPHGNDGSGVRLIRNYPWSECVGTGYHKDRPPFLAVWLLFICDNTLHIGCNALALMYF